MEVRPDCCHSAGGDLGAICAITNGDVKEYVCCKSVSLSHLSVCSLTASRAREGKRIEMMDSNLQTGLDTVYIEI